jgi:hypothetical protein
LIIIIIYLFILDTRWLKHIMRVLSGARRVAEVLHEDGASVLVHCSDGWDRTPQLVALAQLILDPYYRTIRGFAVLVEKEWCSFGHKFADRIGVGKDVADQPNERSPVMLQFLDCVWQMTRQFPACFEFNEKFLLHIADSLISGLYGTFLYNSERERIFEKVWERTESVWSPILEESTPYKNPLYRVTNRVLYPRANLKRVVLWDAMFFRWDPESHPDYIEFMQPMGGVEVDEIDDESAALGAVQKRIGIEISTETTNDELSTSASQLSTSTSLGSSSLVSTFPGSSVTSPPQMPITTDVNIAIEVEQKALQLDVDVIPDFDDKLKSTMSDCSSISDDEDSTSALASSHSSKNSEGEVEVEKDGHVVSSSSGHEILKESGYVVVDDEFIEKHRRGVEERTRQRSQGRNIREALQMAPNHSRIKYLEQLLSESVARELQLEAELDHVYSRVTSSTQRSIANDRS